jgi:hypothetical protein
MYLFKKFGPITLSCVSAHNTFTSALSRSRSKRSLEGSLPKMTVHRLTYPEMWSFALSMKTVQFKKLLYSKICAHMCSVNCDRSCLPRAVSFWTACTLHAVIHRAFRRILGTVFGGICNSTLSREIDSIGLRMYACILRCTGSCGPLGYRTRCQSLNVP